MYNHCVIVKGSFSLMVKLTNICKTYTTGDLKVEALKDVSIRFRKNEFVSVLGPSGCGKTTLLNVLGGLDRYDSGEMSVDGTSTKMFTGSDWDAYRNHSVGFVFQSYNLIGHQSILANVELALTLAGVSGAERRQRAVDALTKVGLGAELKKKPNQLSGGQMQRVAIARALINDPEILLADEPTGALDTETSKQVMDLLSEVAKDRLVIMVTHNPELAEEYSTRIIKLLDGSVISDSNPYEVAEYSTAEADQKKKREKKKRKKHSMSFKTAFTLSLNNLLTKKGRTILTSVAGSIGIIGIALILSLSSGFQNYIDRVQEETLSTYPLTINGTTMSSSAMLNMMDSNGSNSDKREDGYVYSNSAMAEMYNALQSEIHYNDLTALKEYIESEESKITDKATVKYDYGLTLNFYSSDTSKGAIKADSMEIIDQMYSAMTGGKLTYSDMLAQMNGMFGGLMDSMSMNMWSELLDNQDLLEQQYDVLDGRWPEAYNEVVLKVNSQHSLSDMILYAMNLRPREEFEADLDKFVNGEELSTKDVRFSYEELLGLTYKLVLNSELYTKDASGLWIDSSADAAFIKDKVDNGIEIKVVGIICEKETAVAGNMQGVLGYKHELVEYIIEKTAASESVKAQLANPTIDIFTGMPFGMELTADNFAALMQNMPAEDKAMIDMILEPVKDKPIEEQIAYLKDMLEKSGYKASTYESNLDMLGSVNLKTPKNIHIYPQDFEAKEAINAEIDKYNSTKPEANQIQYTDALSLLLSSVSTIINAISYVLIAFVSVSLIVSSIMIGVITYISVLERTKEIGILRAVGASKRDISRVFNAETAIVGLTAGVIGIVTTVVLNIPINIIINKIANIGNISALPWKGGLFLVVLSIIMTLVAGFIPSRMAAKKDPVTALRSE